MNCLKIFRRTIVAGALIGLSAMATVNAGIVKTLPTIRVGGETLYYYDTQSGDNIYSVAEKLGVSAEDIRRYNPSVQDGVKPRMRLFFPTSGINEAAPPEGATKAASSTEATPEGNTHLVKKGESIYGIARQYGMTMEELTELNPPIANGLMAGMRLKVGGSEAQGRKIPTVSIPATPSASEEVRQLMTETVKSEAKSADAGSKKKGKKNKKAAAAKSAPAEQEAAVEQAPAEGVVAAEEEVAPVAAADSVAEIHIAVILPFMLDGDAPGRQTQLYTEFYKGFLLAADTLNLPGRAPIRIHTYDSASNIDSVKAVMARPEMADMKLIISPDNAAQLAAIAEAAPQGAYVLNLFAVKDESYLKDPGMIQTNIPHDEMYERAIQGFIDRYDGFTPVIISRMDGKQDKAEFITELKSALSRRGIAYRTISYEAALGENDLEGFDPSAGPWVFVPVSGNRDEFTRFTAALKTFKGRAENPSAVQLFGYPEWSVFRGSQLSDLYDLQTSIYTRYAPVDKDPEAATLNKLFRTTYGGGLIEKQMPVLGILGYDTGKMVIEGLRTMAGQGGELPPYSGIQSGVALARAGDGGYFNNALFIVTYNPERTIDKVLK